MAAYFVGVDLGGTSIKAGLVDENAVVKTSFSVPTGQGAEAVVKNLIDAAERAIAQAEVDRKDVVGIGIGSPGPMSHKLGMVINPGNLPGMKNVLVREMVSRATGLPVTLENDANAAAWGEFWAGAGKGATDFVMFTLGTGVGGGIITDGKLLRGYYENGGELGHMIVQPGGRRCSCGQPGCLEAYSSAYFLARRAEEFIAEGRASSLKAIVDRGEQIMAEQVVAASKQGDELAKQVWDEACYYLAVACVNLQHATNPQRIVLAGGLIAAGDYLIEPIRRHFKELTWKLLDDYPQILFATLGNDAGFIGAAGCAWQANRINDW